MVPRVAAQRPLTVHMPPHAQTMAMPSTAAPLLVPRRLAASLLRLYDHPHPTQTGRHIRGYDRQHALRTARMSAAVALRLGYGRQRVTQFQIACILHDLGRAGLDRKLFGRIWSWARDHNIPTRPREWRAAFPNTTYGRETESFLAHYGHALEHAGIRMDAWAREHVEMRLGFARRMRRRLRAVKPKLQSQGVYWTPWMTRVTLYYYYPEQLARDAQWVRKLGETLAACEQFEACSNRRRGRDYYGRDNETMHDALACLDALHEDHIISTAIMNTLLALVADGTFDRFISQARGTPITAGERTAVRQRAAM